MSSHDKAIAVVDVAAPVRGGNGVVWERGHGLAEATQTHTRPCPHWPASEVGDDIASNTPLHVFGSPEATLQLHADRSAGWAHDWNLRETVEPLSPREWFISMHVHGINDYGMNIMDTNYEERSEVTTFFSDLETIASLDDPSEPGSSFAASIETDLSERIADIMENCLYHQDESDAVVRSDMQGVSDKMLGE